MPASSLLSGAYWQTDNTNISCFTTMTTIKCSFKTSCLVYLEIFHICRKPAHILRLLLSRIHFRLSCPFTTFWREMTTKHPLLGHLSQAQSHAIFSLWAIYNLTKWNWFSLPIVNAARNRFLHLTNLLRAERRRRLRFSEYLAFVKQQAWNNLMSPSVRGFLGTFVKIFYIWHHIHTLSPFPSLSSYLHYQKWNNSPNILAIISLNELLFFGLLRKFSCENSPICYLSSSFTPSKNCG